MRSRPQTYVKGFLRTYADYLGLDGQLYVDEFNSRFGDRRGRAARAGRSATDSTVHRHAPTASSGAGIAFALTGDRARWSRSSSPR